MPGKVPLQVIIAAARERLHTPYTSILGHPLFRKLYLRLSAHSVRYCWKLWAPFSVSTKTTRAM